MELTTLITLIAIVWLHFIADFLFQTEKIHQFVDPGEYTVEFMITTDRGCTDTAYAEVKVGKTPTAYYKMGTGETEICAINPVEFIDSSYIHTIFHLPRIILYNKCKR